MDPKTRILKWAAACAFYRLRDRIGGSRKP